MSCSLYPNMQIVPTTKKARRLTQQSEQRKQQQQQKKYVKKQQYLLSLYLSLLFIISSRVVIEIGGVRRWFGIIIIIWNGSKRQSAKLSSTTSQAATLNADVFSETTEQSKGKCKATILENIVCIDLNGKNVAQHAHEKKINDTVRDMAEFRWILFSVRTTTATKIWMAQDMPKTPALIKEPHSYSCVNNSAKIQGNGGKKSIENHLAVNMCAVDFSSTTLSTVIQSSFFFVPKHFFVYCWAASSQWVLWCTREAVFTNFLDGIFPPILSIYIHITDTKSRI